MSYTLFILGGLVVILLLVSTKRIKKRIEKKEIPWEIVGKIMGTLFVYLSFQTGLSFIKCSNKESLSECSIASFNLIFLALGIVAILLSIIGYLFLVLNKD